MEAEHNRVKIQALQDQLMERNDDHTQTGRNPTQYTTESQQLSLEPSIRQERTSPSTYTLRSSWRETRYAPIQISSWMETREHKQIPFMVGTQSSPQ